MPPLLCTVSERFLQLIESSRSGSTIWLPAFLWVLLLPAVAQSAELEVRIVDSDGEPVSDAVVEIKLPQDLQASFQEQRELIIDQVDKEFVPTVSVLPRGGRVRFPNSDDILHHVYSFSPTATFNIPLYGKGENIDFFQQLDEPGLVEIGCNIHDWMLAYIYVAETSLSAVTDAAGQVSFDSVPAVDVELLLWHPRLAEVTNSADLLRSLGESSQESVQITVELERGRRIRRAPSSSRRRYN